MYSNEPMRTEVFAGTHQFMSPEVVEGVAEYDACKVDIWACGVTLYNMLTGLLPYDIGENEGPLDLYEKIINLPFSQPSGVEKDLSSLLEGIVC